jgi:circadian clock protein KaiC
VRGGDLKLQCRYPEATSLEDLLVDLRLGLEEFQPSLIVMDSISSIEHASSEKGFRQFMIGVASILRGHGRSALLTQTVLAGTASEHTAPYLSTIADAIISLDYSPAGYELNRSDARSQDARVGARDTSLSAGNRCRAASRSSGGRRKGTEPH